MQAISSTGMHQTVVTQIKNIADAHSVILEKHENPSWYLSIKDGVLGVNCMVPLYIYGAQTVDCIVFDGDVIYNFAKGHPGEKSFHDWALKSAKATNTELSK